jgi:hypothetical protein
VAAGMDERLSYKPWRSFSRIEALGSFVLVERSSQVTGSYLGGATCTILWWLSLKIMQFSVLRISTVDFVKIFDGQRSWRLFW